MNESEMVEEIDDLPELENMPRIKTVEEWQKVLIQERIWAKKNNEKALNILKYFYGSDDYTSSCKYADMYLIQKGIKDWKEKAANSVLIHFNKRAIITAGIPEQIRPNGSKRYWNVGFTYDPIKYKNSPVFTMRLRPELVKAIEIVFPEWQKNIVEPIDLLKAELVNQKKWTPVKDEEILVDEIEMNIRPESFVSQKLTKNIEPRPNYYRNAVTEILNSYDGRKVEERIFREEYEKLKGIASETILKRMRDFFENRKDRYGYDILSYDIEKKRDKFIEVKSTRGEANTPFYLSANEVRFARANIDDYYVYRVVVGEGLKIIPGWQLFRDYYVKPDKFIVYGYPEMDEEKAIDLISKLEWTFAKTYAETAPHEYAIVKVGDAYRGEFVALMRYIFDNGVVETFYGKPYTVCYIGDRKYWCMIDKKEHISDEDTLINRTIPETTNKIYK